MYFYPTVTSRFHKILYLQCSQYFDLFKIKIAQVH